MKPRFKLIAAVYVLFVKDGKILIAPPCEH
jgi:hypothetical protein